MARGDKQAYPVAATAVEYGHDGLTIREVFALEIYCALLQHITEYTPRDRRELAREEADALLAELETKEPKRWRRNEH